MPADADDWPLVLTLLDRALAVPAAERERWIAGCALRERPLRLLRQLLQERPALEAEGFLDALPPFAAEPAAPADDDRGGAQIGPYRLIQVIGRGGMSVVWLAERVDVPTRRRVALKLPRSGPGREWPARHLALERDILGALEHRNIARLYDLGVAANGLPFLVMEHVRGEPLHEYSRARRLGVAARLRLFLQVLNAVQHAHAHFVLHRDLKPSNILVDEQGEVKLLDFGIARLLDPATGSDASEPLPDAQAALTPDYAAPEQIARRPLGAACDVYALGVILHELLCGERPYRLPGANREVMEAALAAARPPLPSPWWRGRAEALDFGSTPRAMRRALGGDLDAIVRQAMQQDAQRRYASAEAFAQDIRRHLARQPVHARLPSRSYRAARFVQRRALALLSAGTVLAALLAGSGIALWQAREARHEAAKATAIKTFLTGLFQTAGVDDPSNSRGRSVQHVLEMSADALAGGLHENDAVRQELMGVVGRLLNDLALTDRAERLRAQRVQVLKALGADPADLGEALRDWAESLQQRGDDRHARALLDEAVALLANKRDERARAQRWAAEASLGHMDMFMNRLDAAHERIERAAAALAALAPDSALQADVLAALGILRHEQGRSAEAVGLFERSFRISARLHADQPARLAHERYEHAMRLLNAGGSLAAARSQLETSLAETRAVAGDGSVNRALIEQQIGRLMIYQGQIADAQRMLDQSAALLAASAGRIDPVHLLKGRLYSVEALLANGRLGQARAAMDQAQALRNGMSLESTEWPLYADYVLAKLDGATGRYPSALRTLEGWLHRLEGQYAPQHADLIDLRLRIATLRLAAGDDAGAARGLERELAAAESGPLPPWWSERIDQLRVGLMIERGQFRAALPLLERQLQAAEALPQSARMAQLLPTLTHRLARVRAGLGERDAALALFERTIVLLEAAGYADNPALAAARADHAASLAAAGRQAEARAQLRRAQRSLAAEPSVGLPVRKACLAAEAQLRRAEALASHRRDPHAG